MCVCMLPLVATSRLGSACRDRRSIGALLLIHNPRFRGRLGVRGGGEAHPLPPADRPAATEVDFSTSTRYSSRHAPSNECNDAMHISLINCIY